MPSAKYPRAFCATLFGEDLENYFDDFDFSPYDYFVAGLEFTNKGLPHWQIFGQTRGQLTRDRGMALLPGAHFDPARGHPYDSAGYCKKGPSKMDRPEVGWRKFFPRTPSQPALENPCNPWLCPIEHGTIKVQGKRTDLEALTKEILDGEVDSEGICVENPMMFHKYGRTLQKIEDIANRKRVRTEMPDVTWYWGEPGVGKTHKMYEGWDPDTTFVWTNDNGWWCGYNGEPTVFINELKQGQICLSDMLLMCDKWPHKVRRRAREPAPFLATKIVITSIMTPREMYEHTGENMDQLYRRMTVIEVTKPHIFGTQNA